MTLTEIKEAVSALPRRADGKVKTVPVDLRREIVVQAKSCGDEVVSRELGIHPVTIYGWRRRKKAPKTAQKFRRVEVLPEVRHTGLVVEGPRGLRILGLGISEVAQLFREVAGEF